MDRQINCQAKIKAIPMWDIASLAPKNKGINVFGAKFSYILLETKKVHLT